VQDIDLDGYQIDDADTDEVGAVWTAQREDAAFRAAGVTTWVLQQRIIGVGTVKMKDHHDLSSWFESAQAVNELREDDDPGFGVSDIVGWGGGIKAILNTPDGCEGDWAHFVQMRHTLPLTPVRLHSTFCARTSMIPLSAVLILAWFQHRLAQE
jgi:hypothetical protein